MLVMFPWPTKPKSHVLQRNLESDFFIINRPV